MFTEEHQIHFNSNCRMLFPQFGGPGTLRLFGFRLAFEAALRISLETMAATSVFETGKMTKDLAILISPDAPWLNTQEFLAAIDDNLKVAMAK